MLEEFQEKVSTSSQQNFADNQYGEEDEAQPDYGNEDEGEAKLMDDPYYNEVDYDYDGQFQN